jgi:hypothetical protein
VVEPPVGVEGSRSMVGLPPVGVEGSHSAVGLPPVGVEGSHSAVGLPPVGVEGSHSTVEPPPIAVEESHSTVELPAVAVEESPLAEPEPMAIEEPPPPPTRPTAVVPTHADERIGKSVNRMHRQRANAHRWYRRLPARLGALLALVVIAGAIVLLVHALGGSSATPPPPPLRIVKITIPEGFTRAQIAALATEDRLKGSYLAASTSSPYLHPVRYGAPASTPNLEGFLFPATYELYSTSSAEHLVEDQLAAFRENFNDAEIRRARELGVTPYGLLTIASMIEREAQTEHDRPLVAAVIYNRLHRNMALGIDSTLRYALNDFSAPLTEAQLHDTTPYNTRLHTGLPPTPISNPGRAAILAAAHPAHVSYLYYVAAPDGCGELLFSTSFATFEHDAALYREAIANNHGRVPACHKR